MSDADFGPIDGCHQVGSHGGEQRTGLPGIMAQLGDIEGQMIAANGVTGAVFSAAVRAQATADHHVKQVTEAIKAASVALVKAQMNEVIANTQVALARAELEGEKGFLNGFLTAVTFTIHNPVQDNLNRASANQALAQMQRSLQLAHQARLTALRREKREGLQAMSRLGAVQTGVAKLRNATVTAKGRLGTALIKITASDSVTSDAAMTKMLTLARKYIDALFAWLPGLATIR